MEKLRYILLFLVFIGGTVLLSAQELNCSVNVNARQIEGSERKVFEEMEKAIYQFVNGRKWTNDEYETSERIDCSILITLSERSGGSTFKGNIQVQASRPIYNSAYDSPIMNVKDDNFVIYYNQFEPLVYSESSYNGELSSILSYYVYMILGYDYDSFSPKGGTVFFQQAQKIVSNAQSSSQAGWKAFESQKNRYWLVENALSARFNPLRDTYYNYHRKGFDMMESNTDRARKALTESLKNLKKVHSASPSSYNLQAFFDAKSNEIVNLYKEAPAAEVSEITQLLITIDPGNSNKYEKLRKN